MNTAKIIVLAVQPGVVVVAAPLMTGMVRKVQARLEGRVGAPVSQPWRDLRKLWRKERIAPEHSSWLFAVTPLVLVASCVVIAMIAPVLTLAAPMSRAGDLFTVVSLFLLATVFLALAGLDPGTAFGGMGASREMTIAALAEPTLLVAVYALSSRAGSTNLSEIVHATLSQPRMVLSVQSVFALVALAIATVAECARLPVDNPRTHLELTMVHEAMVLEYAGPDLALVELAASMRLALFGVLLANLFVPWGIARDVAVGSVVLAIGALVLKLAVLAAALGVFETFTPKVRLFRVPELLALSFVVAFLAVIAAVFL
jgi:formate hydrogenlyase subunit 4